MWNVCKSFDCLKGWHSFYWKHTENRFRVFLQCIKCIEELFKTLVEPEGSPLSFLMTYKLSQDHLETFFSLIQNYGSYNNPSVKQFKDAIVSSGDANCLPLSQIHILSVSSKNRSASNFINEINHRFSSSFE